MKSREGGEPITPLFAQASIDPLFVLERAVLFKREALVAFVCETFPAIDLAGARVMTLFDAKQVLKM